MNPWLAIALIGIAALVVCVIVGYFETKEYVPND